jgi:heme-degrading monooxygenase HmoA
MLHARLDVITVEPPGLGECVTYIETKSRPTLEGMHGSLGLSVLTSPESSVAVLESFWASHDALRASEPAATALRDELAGQAGRTVNVERYEVPVFEQEAPVRGTEAARLTRIEVKPSAVTDVIEAFGDSAVPWLAESPGFCGALLFADRASGYVISQTLWQDTRARAASPSTAAVVQADLLETAHCVIGGVDDYTLVFSSARKY